MVRLVLVVMIGRVSIHGTSLLCERCERSTATTRGFPGSLACHSLTRRGSRRERRRHDPHRSALPDGRAGARLPVIGPLGPGRAPLLGSPIIGLAAPPRSRHGSGRECKGHGRVGLMMGAEHGPAIDGPVAVSVCCFRIVRRSPSSRRRAACSLPPPPLCVGGSTYLHCVSLPPLLCMGSPS